MTMSNEIPPENKLNLDFHPVKEVELLSTRNQKRFGKLLNSVELIIKSLEDENNSLKESVKVSEASIRELEEVREITIVKEKKNTILSEQDILSARYVDSRDESEEVKTLLSPYSSSMSTYGNEIIWFSIIVGLVFDFLLWKDIFHEKFGIDSWAERAERASAVIMSFSYAYMSSQLGVVSAIKTIVNKRNRDKDTNPKEIEIYNKFTSKNTFLPTIVIFSLLTILSTSARYAQKGLMLSDKFILSLAAVSIGLVIAMISYWYHDVYDYFIKAAANEEKKNKRLLDKLNKKLEKNK